MSEKPSSKHVTHIRATRGCDIEQAKVIAIKHNIRKQIKRAESIKELKHQMLRIVDVI